MTTENDDKPVVLIVGAGFGGLGCARKLVKNGATEKFKVILVESKDYFTIGGMWQFVWNNRLESLDETRWPLAKADLPGIDLRMNTTVTEWRAAEQTAKLSDGTDLAYDHIVVACGITPDPIPVPGIETVVNICSEHHVERQQQQLEALVAKAKTGERVTFGLSICAVPYKCPPAPYEFCFLVDEFVRKAGVRDNVRIVLTCPVEYSMPPPTKPVMLGALAEAEIEFQNFKEPERVEGNTVYFKDGSDPLECAVLWSVWPIRAPDFVQESGVPINPKGTVSVNDKVIHTIAGVPNAHIIGDACAVPVGPKAVPKAGEFAWKMGESVADSIAGRPQPADRQGSCAAEAGFGKGFVLSPNYSDACNDPEQGKPSVKIEKTDAGTKHKIDWVNGYLREVFGGSVPPVALEEEE